MVPKSLAVPALEYSLPPRAIRLGSDGQSHGRLPREGHSWWTIVLDDIKAVAPAQEVVTLPGYELPLGLPLLLRELRTAATDPAQMGDNSQSNSLVVQAQGNGHAHPARRWVDTKV